MARITNEQIMAMFNELKAENAELRKELAVVKSTKMGKKSTRKNAPKKATKKSTWIPREEYKAQFTDAERSAYGAAKNAVRAEMLAEAKASGKYWSASNYKVEFKKRLETRLEKEAK